MRQGASERKCASDVDEVGEVERIGSGGFGFGELIGEGNEGEVRIGGRVGGVEEGVADDDGEAIGVEDVRKPQYGRDVSL